MFIGEEVEGVSVEFSSVGAGVVVDSFDEDVGPGSGVEEFVSLDCDCVEFDWVGWKGVCV